MFVIKELKWIKYIFLIKLFESTGRILAPSVLLQLLTSEIYTLGDCAFCINKLSLSINKFEIYVGLSLHFLAFPAALSWHGLSELWHFPSAKHGVSEEQKVTVGINTNHFMQTTMTYIKCFYELCERSDRFRWIFKCKETQSFYFLSKPFTRMTGSPSRWRVREYFVSHSLKKCYLNLKMDIKVWLIVKLLLLRKLL